MLEEKIGMHHSGRCWVLRRDGLGRSSGDQENKALQYRGAYFFASRCAQQLAFAHYPAFAVWAKITNL
jgi:hypothetical protein